MSNQSMTSGVHGSLLMMPRHEGESRRQPYQIIPQSIPQSQRAEVNEKILFGIDTVNGAITPEAVYNCYTGIGGLHNLQREDYANYHEYSEAKKELEIGQFFTPHTVCRDMVELLAPAPEDMVLDMCCGMGNFLNWLPNRHNAYGFDIDGNAVNVARFLYPEANLSKCDIIQYNPGQRFDAVIGNPPFNMKLDGLLSQFYYMTKAHEVLNPAGFLSETENKNWHNAERKKRVPAPSGGILIF